VTSEIVLDVAERARTLLNERGFDYVIVGGLALQPWGRLRSTLDVDLLVLVSEQEVPSFQAVLWEAGFIFRHATPTHLAQGMLIQTYVEHIASGLEVRADFLVVGTAFQHNVIQRKRSLNINGHTFYVASCEDLILLKLLANRPIDRVDAAELWALNASALDLDYIRQWAASLGITAELEECVSQSN
jgi:hypothetical protein